MGYPPKMGYPPRQQPLTEDLLGDVVGVFFVSPVGGITAAAAAGLYLLTASGAPLPTLIATVAGAVLAAATSGVVFISMMALGEMDPPPFGDGPLSGVVQLLLVAAPFAVGAGVTLVIGWLLTSL
jgi:hypothetical protein